MPRTDRRGRALPEAALAVLAALTLLAGCGLMAAHALGVTPGPGAPDPRPAAWVAAAMLGLAALPWALAARRALTAGFGAVSPLRHGRPWRLGLCAVLFPYLLTPLLTDRHHRLVVVALLAVGAGLLGAWLWRTGESGRARPLLRIFERLATGLALAVLALELGLRALAWVAPSPFTVEADGTPERLIDAYRLGPDAPPIYRVNALGFHDTEFDPYRPAGCIRIAAVSDSFGVGVVPYAQNVFTLLEEQLRTALPGRTVEVYNFSVANASPSAYLALLAGEVRPYAPDLVLVMLFAGNDFEFRRAGLLDVNLLYVNRALPRLWAWFASWAEGDAATADRDGASGGAEWTPPSFSPEAFLRIERTRFETIARPGLAARSGPVLERLRQLKAVARAPLVLAVAPDELQVRASLREQLTAGLPSGSYELLQVQRIVRELARHEGIDELDLTPALAATEAAGTRTYLTHNTHWNEAGNRVAAEALAAGLSPVLRRHFDGLPGVGPPAVAQPAAPAASLDPEQPAAAAPPGAQPPPPATPSDSEQPAAAATPGAQPAAPAPPLAPADTP